MSIFFFSYASPSGFFVHVLEESILLLKEVNILAIILVPLIMTLSRGHTVGRSKNSHNEVIMTSLQGQ